MALMRTATTRFSRWRGPRTQNIDGRSGDQRPVSSRFAMRRLDHAAELLTTFNVLELDGRPLGDLCLITRRPVVSMAVRAIGVVVGRVRLDQLVEMVAAKHNEVL